MHWQNLQSGLTGNKCKIDFDKCHKKEALLNGSKKGLTGERFPVQNTIIHNSTTGLHKKI